jgi:hypothetical protein
MHTANGLEAAVFGRIDDCYARFRIMRNVFEFLCFGFGNEVQMVSRDKADIYGRPYGELCSSTVPSTITGLALI